jgi:SSS family solute:Na+ symporter
MTVTFAALDYVLLGLYFALLVVIGVATAVRRRRRGPPDPATDSENFLVAGRTLSLPAFVATLVATWYGGILGVGEFAYTSGVATWTVFGLPYYVFAVVYALFLAGRVRGAARLTIPDTLEAAHGRPVALLGALWVFLLVTPAPYVLMLGTLLRFVFGLDLVTATIAGTLLSVAFVVTGGFNTDVRTNVAQFVLMFAAFALLVGFAWARAGDLSWLAARLPDDLKKPSGGLSLPYIVVWYFIALWTLVDPGFHQRCSAAKDARTARHGILVSVACWAVFDFLTITAGLYAHALLPDLTPAVDAYPALSQAILPPGVKGFFWVGMLATVMSTVLSYTFIAAITLGRDIVWRARITRIEDDVWWTRVGLVLSAILSILAAFNLPSVVGLWYTIGTAFVPGLLVPLLSAYAPARLRAAPAWTFAASLLGTGLPIAWMVLGAHAGGLDASHYPLGWEPMYVGLGASLLVWALGQTTTFGRHDRGRKGPDQN